MNIHPYTFPAALAQISKCDFECEAGPLSSNVAWQWLEAMEKVCPAFMPGQGVWFQIEADAAGKKLKQWVHFYIVGCDMHSSTVGPYWRYSLSYDPPRAYHYGTTHFQGIEGCRLFLTKPTDEVVS